MRSELNARGITIDVIFIKDAQMPVSNISVETVKDDIAYMKAAAKATGGVVYISRDASVLQHAFESSLGCENSPAKECSSDVDCNYKTSCSDDT